MASFTMPLREIVEWATQFDNKLTRNEKIEEGRKKLFDFFYPIETDYKKEFETKFIKHFYFREIGFETEGRFKFALEEWLNLNMPYWNKIIESTHLDYNPLYNVDYKKDSDLIRNLDQVDNRVTDSKIENNGKASSESNVITSEKGEANSIQDADRNSTAKKKRMFEDTPDGRLDIVNDNNIIQYATDLTQEDSTDSVKDKIKNDSSSKNDSTGNTTAEGKTNNITEGNNVDDFKSEKDEKQKLNDHIYGKQGNVSYPQLIKEHREAILNVERMIFDQMEELFMFVYN
ncbi:adaptor Ad4 [Bacillus phage GA1]|uniref:Lower collar protein n=1 Tax=Bacillus phage GA-1 TaxID=2679898 RepID=Q9FZW4_BPGA1|nr:adaptor Ad4 [Bacillus phage GA1]CAC21532.1 lower collar protein [Bacillus phage GA1]